MSGLRFENYRIAAVTGEYSAGNVLTFNDKQLYPYSFENSAFLVILNGASSTKKSSIYVIVIGNSDAEPALVCLGKNESGIYPILDKTSTNRIYVKWSATATGTMYVNIFKLC